jgi:hypothetical protein
MSTILRSTAGTITVLVYNAAGTLTNFDAAPTVTAVDATGAPVTIGVTTHPPAVTGTYLLVLPAQAALKLIDVSLAGAISTNAVTVTQSFEVVGANLFTEAALRDFRTNDGSGLTVAAGFTDEMISEQRIITGDLFEDSTGISFIPRYVRVEAAGTGTNDLYLGDGLPRWSTGAPLLRPGRLNYVAEIVSVTVDGIAVATANFVVDGVVLRRTDDVWTLGDTTDPANVIIEYVYGLTVPPADIARAAVIHARFEIASRDFFDRTYAIDSDIGVQRRSLPGPNHPTGVPTVDSVLARYRML